jgi:D-glycero-D-manno-heptose 1,7-bisphosphate phosphatase
MNSVALPAFLRDAVFLDRDGVINLSVIKEGKPYPPVFLSDLVLYPGVVEACQALKQAGFLLIIATNQPDVGRGTQSREVVEAMHEQLREWLPIDHVAVCYDSGQGAFSPFYKPAPGMLLQAAQDFGIDLGNSYMIGDRWRDIDCGHAAGCKTIFIDRGYVEKLRQDPDYRVHDLGEATEIILTLKYKKEQI